jgi:hypothetical protein
MMRFVQGKSTHTDRHVPRIVYLVITLGCLITAGILWFSEYHGYGGLVLAIGLAAAINLKR